MFPFWSSAAHHSARLVTKEERREPCGALGTQLEAQARGMGAQRPQVLEDTSSRPALLHGAAHEAPYPSQEIQG